MLRSSQSPLQLIALRLFLLVLGFGTNILIANFLISKYGVSYFAYYSALIAIPNLLPFADFGLGISVYNYFSSAKRMDDSTNSLKHHFSTIFSVLTFSSILCAAISIIFMGITDGSWIASDNPIGNEKKAALIILLLTWISIPFTLGLRKLEGESRVELSQIIQGLIPIFTLIGIFFPFVLGIDGGIWLSCVPALAYLTISIVGFFAGDGFRNLCLLNIEQLKSNFLSAKSVAFWSLAYSTLMMLTYQIPKFLLLNLSHIDASAAYSYSLMFVLPVISLGMAGATWLAPRSRQMSWNLEKFHFLKKNTSRSLILILAVYVTAIAVEPIATHISIRFPKVSELILDMIFVLTILLWQIPFAAMSESNDFRRVTLQLFFLLAFFFAISDLSRDFTYQMIIVKIFIPTNILMGVLTWKRIINKTNFSK